MAYDLKTAERVRRLLSDRSDVAEKRMVGAVGKFKGIDKQIGEAWNWLLRDWLPGSGMQLDSRPFFEHYPVEASFDQTTGVFESEICIPVTPM